jgi:transposase
LLPDTIQLRLEACLLDDEARQITVVVKSMQTTSPCPLCATPASRIHSRYERTLEDLPWADFRVRLWLRVRKWFCDASACPRQIFTERLPNVAVPWARRTRRLARRLVAVGLALGGRAGRQLGARWDLKVSRNTLLRLIRRLPLPLYPAPTVVGVDDWSLRKRHTYGTILVDLETHRPLALLDDREADTFAQWLRAHPGVEIVSRDRSKAYEEGARQGAPDAIHVADRFHLLQNLAEALDQVFNAHVKTLGAFNQARSQKPVPQPDGTVAAPVPPPPNPTAAVVRAQQRRARRLAIDNQVWDWHRQGYSGYAIARQLGIGKSTVFRYLRTSTFPERRGRSDVGRSLLDPYKPYLMNRWNEGCREALALFHELKRRGYPGSYATVARYAQRLRQAQGLSRRQRLAPKPVRAVSEPTIPLLTPRGVTWLVMKRLNKREASDEQVLQDLQRRHPELEEVIALARDFAHLVRERQPDQLDPWLERAASCRVDAFRRFAKRLREDYDSIQAGVTLPWSKGPVEGHINRLKMLKRQMFGRAKLDLLSQRFLQPRCDPTPIPEPVGVVPPSEASAFESRGTCREPVALEPVLVRG